VLAIGEPYGLDRSVAAGIVGGRSRHFAEDGELLFIQTDLSLNPGNSGGPLLDTEGRIVGMNLRTVVGALGGPGLSLSVPIEVVLQITAEIAAHGSVTRPRLGAGFEDVTPFVAVARGRAYASGALIHDVTPGSVAARLGLREGDIVVGMNGTAIGDSADLARALLRWRTVSGSGARRPVHAARGENSDTFGTLRLPLADCTASAKASRRSAKLPSSISAVLNAALRIGQRSSSLPISATAFGAPVLPITETTATSGSRARRPATKLRIGLARRPAQIGATSTTMSKCRGFGPS
jgi:hypothetical protein